MNIRIVILTGVLLFTAHTACAEIVSVKGENVNLRSGPGTSYSVKWEYGKGFPLRVIERKGDWVKVKDFEKDAGWIHGSLLNNTPHVIVDVNRNNQKKINIRKGPATKYEIVGKAYYGVVFERLERKNGWSKVKHESGVIGWIKDTLLWGN